MIISKELKVNVTWHYISNVTHAFNINSLKGESDSENRKRKHQKTLVCNLSRYLSTQYTFNEFKYKIKNLDYKIAFDDSIFEPDCSIRSFIAFAPLSIKLILFS